MKPGTEMVFPSARRSAACWSGRRALLSFPRPPAPPLRTSTLLVALLLALGFSRPLPCFAQASAAASGAIPDRPEKLVFQPLAYEPPDPAQYRVALQSGPVAYVVPDRELPLVNLVIYVRTGKYP